VVYKLVVISIIIYHCHYIYRYYYHYIFIIIIIIIVIILSQNLNISVNIIFACGERKKVIERNAFSPTGEAMCVYGDPAYPLRVHLQASFRHGILTPMMEEYKAEMGSVRVTVEWLFGDIIKDFKFLDFKKNLKISMSRVGKMYLVCALLQNAITCL